MRVAIDGFQHETNTFAPSKASFEHFGRDAYERIPAMIVDGIRDARADAVYLDLHGAMAAEHLAGISI